jgi:hypothetical protein
MTCTGEVAVRDRKGRIGIERYTAASFSMPLGNNRFNAPIEAVLGRQIGQAKRGRPLRCLQD